MNVLMKNRNFCLSVHKQLILGCLFIVNVTAFVIQNQSQISLFGTIEALDYRWSTYSNLNKDIMTAQVVFAKLTDEEALGNSSFYQYQYDKSKGAEYIAIGEESTLPVRYNRVFYLDELCMLFFSGQSNLTLKNVSLRCLY